VSVLPSETLMLAGVVFVLGVRHGFDADHLATIDGLTRFNTAAGKGFARYCGALFSIGHGAVVVATAIAAAILVGRWSPPGWLTTSGLWLSITVLAALGLVNLRAVATADPRQVVAPVGLKGRFLGRLARASHPALIGLIGALFAISFDTISQAVLFSVTAARIAGIPYALALGGVFTAGMLIVDGANGLWVARMIRRSDAAARIASRVMATTLAVISIAVAALGASRSLLPAVDSWSDNNELLCGFAVMATVLGAFLFSMWIGRRFPVSRTQPVPAYPGPQ
jgi:high-affinity nickel-transport protein